MERQRKQAPGWLYTPLIVLLLLVAYQPLKQMGLADNIAATENLRAIPTESFETLMSEYTTIMRDALENQKLDGDPEALPRFTHRRTTGHHTVSLV